ncbi:MAG: DISARM system phospholipase D-like protein DrmC [Verrucomicrobiota bacterium]
MDGNLTHLLDLPASTLLELGNALRGGSLRYGVSAGMLSPFAGNRAGDLASALQSILNDGCSTEALGTMCLLLHTAKARMETNENALYLALSGPDVPGTPVVSTPTVVRSLFEEAKHNVIVASYVFYQCRDLLAPLAAKLDADPNFKVRFIVDLSHQRQHATEPLPIVANRFKTNFLSDLWTGNRQPEFWHDPRIFEEEDRKKAGVMHAKVVIIDTEAALVTSANFTEAAQNRNIEAGVIVRQTHQVGVLRSYFEGLIDTGGLRPLV